MAIKIKPKSVIFYSVMALVSFVLVILSLVALGSFAAKSTELKQDLASIYRGSDEPCWLYAGGPFTFRPRSGPERNCDFVIFGEVVVFLASTALLIVSVVKAIVSADILSLLGIIELAVVGVGLLFGLVTAGVISAGLKTTCDALSNSGLYPPTLGCPSFTIPSRRGFPIDFFQSFNRAQITTWLAFIVLLGCLVVYIVLTVLYCLFRPTLKKSYEPKLPHKRPADKSSPSMHKKEPQSEEDALGEVRQPT